MYSKDLKGELSCDHLEKPPSGCLPLLGRMKCFLFQRDEQRSPKPLSPLSDHRSGFTNNGSTSGSGTSTRFRLIIDPRLEGKYLIKPVQRLAVVANLCLARNPKARPKMSEVLEMVTKIVETSSPRSGGKKQLLPLRSLSRDEEEKSNKVVDGGEGGWLDKLWNPKNVRAC
ncbi:hypothetical protein HID58_039841 [Brassica napus]|uniref:Uncharacterized protein n=1 Tax=Brassica napus TaxID=3708 RepID=A0ABQ8BT87_BRANA|nr:hypothetical protein HID58_039841 [Brassica napus]